MSRDAPLGMAFGTITEFVSIPVRFAEPAKLLPPLLRRA